MKCYFFKWKSWKMWSIELNENSIIAIMRRKTHLHIFNILKFGYRNKIKLLKYCTTDLLLQNCLKTYSYLHVSLLGMTTGRERILSPSPLHMSLFHSPNLCPKRSLGFPAYTRPPHIPRTLKQLFLDFFKVIST